MFKQIGRNAIAIVLVQAINFLVPLAALPQISRALNLHGFGLYSIALAYGNYVLLFSDFSFNVNGPTHVSRSLRAGELRALLLDSTMLKLGIAVIGCCIYAMTIQATTGASLAYVLAGVTIPLTLSLTPRWMMYGLNRLYSFAMISLASKAIWLALVYLLVRSPADLVPLLLYTGATQAAIALSCYYIIIKEGSDRPTYSARRIRDMFTRDFQQVLAIVSTAVVRDLAILLLSFTALPATVSLYSLADRVRFAVMSVVAPVSQSLFLLSARERAGIGEAVKQRVRGLTNAALIAFALAGGLAMSIGSPLIVNLLGGRQFAAAIPLLRVLSFVPTFTALNSVLGANTLLAQGHEKDYAMLQLVSVGFAVPLLGLLILGFGASGAAWGALGVEVIGSILLAFGCVRRGILHSAFAVRG